MLDNRSTGNAEPSVTASTTPGSVSDAEVTALANRVATARGKLPLQSDPALFAELSEAEIAAERELAEWMRAQRRQQRRRAVAAELAAEKRDRRVALALRRADDDDARWHRRALASRRRVSNPDARLAQLYRRAEWSSRALIGVVVLGMLWSGVNVQHNLVPSGDMADPLYWLSYGFEAMISIPIITIMVVATTAARWGREIARGKVVFLEAALLGVTIALNAGPHLAAGALARAAEAAVAPVMVGVVIWLHAWVSTRYAQLIEAIPATADVPGEPARHYPATTVEFGEPCPTPHAEFDPGTPESAALPIGHTTRPDAAQFDLIGGQFDTSGGQFGFATPQFDTAGATSEQPQPVTDLPRVDATVATPDPRPARSPESPDTERDTRTVSGTAPESPSRVEHDKQTAPSGHPIAHGHNGIAVEPEARRSTTAPTHPVTDSPGATDAPASGGALESEPVPSTATHTPEPADPLHNGQVDDHNHLQRPTHPTTTTSHPYDRRPIAMTDAAESPRRTDRPASADRPTSTVRPSPERGTQLALDEHAPTDAPPRRRPRIVPAAAPAAPAQISRDYSHTPEAPDTWDDDITPDTDDAKVWAVAREISERRLSKLPVEQLAEVLTLADESWTPAAIGASIGLPGSRIVGILEAARRLSRPYAISG
jgi:hypothetical protein